VSAIVGTSFNDNDGRTLLTLAYPKTSSTEYFWQRYDLVGNRLEQRHYSTTGGITTLWATNQWVFDGLNRATSETGRDGATTTHSFDALGDELSRLLPNGMTWSATYNNDGSINSEQDSNGSTVSRSTTYAYYQSNEAWPGLFKTVTDGRGVTR